MLSFFASFSLRDERSGGSLNERWRENASKRFAAVAEKDKKKEEATFSIELDPGRVQSSSRNNRRTKEEEKGIHLLPRASSSKQGKQRSDMLLSLALLFVASLAWFTSIEED